MFPKRYEFARVSGFLERRQRGANLEDCERCEEGRDEQNDQAKVFIGPLARSVDAQVAEFSFESGRVHDGPSLTQLQLRMRMVVTLTIIMGSQTREPDPSRFPTTS